MQMPNNYESTKVGGDFTPVNLGGHHMVIKQVAERKNKKGGDMIVVLFDFAANDSQPGYFTEAFRDDVRPDKKWSHNGTAYINVNDQNGQCSRSFKGFITSCEKSNKFTVAWGENFCAQFKGKKIGGIFGEVENEYNGKTTMRHELRWFCEDAKVDGAQIPKPKYLENKTAPAPGGEEFMKVPETEEDSIPF